MIKIRSLILGLLCCLSGYSSQGFSFLGPFKSWQTKTVGYDLSIGDIGGPMFPSEGYRWNVPTIYYAFDRSFIEYFGASGVAAVDEAFSYLNALPAASAMSADLAEFPLNTRQVNYEAQALGLTDLKSLMMGSILEELGLASPEHFTWTLAGRVTVGSPTVTNYSVIRLNYDPVTLTPSSYVNGALYSYYIAEVDRAGLVATAAEIKIGDLRTAGFTSVAGGGNAGGSDQVLFAEQNPVGGGLSTAYVGAGEGEYYFGLTRDDVGGLRRLYGTRSMAVEALLPGVNASAGGAWTPVGGTNAVGTNAVAPALRPGVNKLSFQKVIFDSVLGQTFAPFASRYTDYYTTNSQVRSRSVSRQILQPDIIFTVADILPFVNGYIPATLSRTTTAGWVNNSALNSGSILVPAFGAQGGPGVIPPTVQIVLNSMWPFAINQNPGFSSEGTQYGRSIYGSFDGSTNAPVVYPIFGGFTVDTLRQLTVRQPGQ